MTFMAVRCRRIELDGWPRQEHYVFFRRFGFPFFSVTSPVDVTSLRGALKRRGASFTLGFVYALTRAANAIPEFRQRIRDEGPVEHEAVDPAITVLCEGDLFRFCFLQHLETFGRFVEDAARRIQEVRARASLGSQDVRDDALFCTALPWLSFSGMLHPMPLNPTDSVPRIAWGRFEERDGRLVMPLNVQAHHALVDGIHIARLHAHLEALLRDPERLLGDDHASPEPVDT